MDYVLYAAVNNEGNKVQIVIGRTGEVRITDVKADKLLITNNVPYGSTFISKRWTKSNKRRNDLLLGIHLIT